MDDKNYESWGWGWKKITGHLEFEDFGWIRPVQSSGMSLLRIVNTGSTSVRSFFLPAASIAPGQKPS